MNEQLQKAEHALLKLLHQHPQGVSMDEILKELRSETEAELRAAVWTLSAGGAVEFDDGVLKEAQPA